MSPERHSQLQDIFEAAVNLEEPDRSAYLDQACAGDAGLRDHLLQLLSADEETIVMTEPMPAPAGSGVMECPKCLRCYERPLATCPRDGTILEFAFAGPQLIDGKYLVEQRLGRGGMGAVYLAQHVALEKRFALKLILQDGALSPAHRENFENEARALGRLSHRHIVGVSDYGVDPRGGGLPYLVMEHLVGRPLNEVLRERKILPFPEAFSLLRATAEAVDAAHRGNIVHGDLKPANLFLAEDRDSGSTTLKVVDFGLALLDSDATSQDRENGSLRGTAAYMAPEILRGEGASPATDRFAFGVLIYELLTGLSPFGRHLAEVAANVKKPAAPPSERNPDLPIDIDAPVLALLNPDPAARPSTAIGALAAVTQAWLRAEQRKWRAREWPRRLLLAAGAAAISVLIAGALGQLHFVRAFEGRIADQRFALLPATPPDPSLSLVSIDDATINADQRPLADRSAEFAAAIDSMFASGARGVAVDLLLPARWSQSPEFAKTIVSHADRLALAIFSAPSGDVVGTECVSRLTAYLLGPQKYSSLFGLANLEEDEDRTIRHARIAYVDKSRHSRQSFGSRAVEAAFPERFNADPPTAPFWIDYSVRARDLTPLSWKDLPARLSMATGLFRDRLVIVGATFAGNGDEHRVPPSASKKLVAGQVVQALIASTILAGDPIRQVPLSTCLAAAGMACLVAIAAALCFPQHYFVSVLASIILLGGYAGLAFWIFRSSRTMIAVAGPELVVLVSMLAAWGLKSILSPYPATEL
jgi:CHASE2 domain-containing sensor protein